jgi:hypothetical protein
VELDKGARPKLLSKQTHVQSGSIRDYISFAILAQQLIEHRLHSFAANLEEYNIFRINSDNVFLDWHAFSNWIEF